MAKNIEVDENGYTLDYLSDGSPIFQNPSLYTFSSDSTNISKYVDEKSAECVVDLCSGSGIVGFEIIGRIKTNRLYLVELQRELASMSESSAKLSKTNTQIEVINASITDIESYLSPNIADIIVSNPPYFKSGSGYQSENKSKALARHELEMTLEDLFKATSYLLKTGGSFYLVHISSRKDEIYKLANKYNFEIIKQDILSGKLERIMLKFTKKL